MLEGKVAHVPPQGGRKHPHQDFIQLNTKDILFVMGGSFEGIDKIIECRTRHKSMGFGSSPVSKRDRRIGELLTEIMPEDLLRFGMIPEFVGRVPIIATFEPLTEADLMHILTEPKNALVKQFSRLLRMEGVELEITAKAMQAISRKAIRQKTGARGLRRIIEDLMLDLMYEIPSNPDIAKVIINERSVDKKDPFQLIYRVAQEQTA